MGNALRILVCCAASALASGCLAVPGRQEKCPYSMAELVPAPLGELFAAMGREPECD